MYVLFSLSKQILINCATSTCIIVGIPKGLQYPDPCGCCLYLITLPVMTVVQQCAVEILCGLIVYSCSYELCNASVSCIKHNNEVSCYSSYISFVHFHLLCYLIAALSR